MRNSKALALISCAALCLALALVANAARQSDASSGPQIITTANRYQLLGEIAYTHLVQTYSVPITFEDTLHVSDAEIDMTGEMPRYRPDRVSITYTMTPPPASADLATRKAALAPVLQDVVKKYNAARGAEIYQIVESDIGFHIVPTLFLDTAGNMEKFHSILETPVTIPPGEKTIGDVFDQITKQLNAVVANVPPYSDFTISFAPLGGPPRFLHIKTNLTATNEPARSIFDRAFAEIRANFYAYPNAPVCCTWQLNTTPGPAEHGGGIMHINLAPAPKIAATKPQVGN